MTINDAIKSLQKMAKSNPLKGNAVLYLCLDGSELEYQEILKIDLDPSQTEPGTGLGLVHVNMPSYHGYPRYEP